MEFYHNDAPHSNPIHCLRLEVDDVLGLLSFNDLGLIPPAARTFDFVMLKNCFPQVERLHYVHSWPCLTGFPYVEILEVREKFEGRAGEDIDCRMSMGGGNARNQCNERRRYGVDLLKKRFGSRVKTDFIRDKGEYREALAESACMLHISGAFANSFDRSSSFAFATGLPLICPHVLTITGWERPRPLRDYVPFWEDMSDMVTQVELFLDDAELQMSLRRNSVQFWELNCSPKSCWQRAKFMAEKCRDRKVKQLPIDNG